jgi:hypothetical protein
MRDENDKADYQRDGEQQHPKPTEEPEHGERKHVNIVALPSHQVASRRSRKTGPGSRARTRVREGRSRAAVHDPELFESTGGWPESPSPEHVDGQAVSDRNDNAGRGLVPVSSP